MDKFCPAVTSTKTSSGYSGAAWPERLWVVARDGKIGFKGELGPDGYLPEKVREYLDGLQLGEEQ